MRNSSLQLFWYTALGHVTNFTIILRTISGYSMQMSIGSRNLRATVNAR